jgi:hypothetical protein
MKDDLFERLRTVDPATDERIVQESRALGNAPRRIAESEPTNVHRFPKSARRKATLAAVAAVVVVAIALPLMLLHPLGEGAGIPGDEPGNWVPVGSLVDLRSQGIVYLSEINAFVLAPADAEPYALWAATGDPLVIGDFPLAPSPRALFCEPTNRFVSPGGDVFDQHGVHESGPVQRGLGEFPVRVTDGMVEVEVSEVTALGARDSSGNDPLFPNLGCLTAGGIPLEGMPGFAIPAGTALPPIAVASPQAGMRVQSPITIAGSANVFEATVSIRVLDATANVIAESFTTATCGTGCRGDFSTLVDVPIDIEQRGTIQVFESSAQDGSMINTVEIPVTLVPGRTPQLEGVWYDGDGVPLKSSSVASEGTTIDVFFWSLECRSSGGSATFMNLAWPLGTIALSFDDQRQYVRDPEGLFDDALRVGYLADTTLPSDAVDTGYHRGPWQLWVSPNQADDAVFVLDGDTNVVERWGRSSQPILCN